MRPATTWHARVSLPFTLAEAFHFGKVDAESYSPERLRDPALLAFSERVEYVVDETAPGREQWRGWVIVEMHDGSRRERIQPYNWGSPQNPLSQEDVEAKFRANSVPAIGANKSESAIRQLRGLESAPTINEIVETCIVPRG